MRDSLFLAALMVILCSNVYSQELPHKGTSTISATYSNIEYGTEQGHLDIYLPSGYAITKGGPGNSSTPYPVIIAISNDGSKSAASISQMVEALPYGYAVVAIEYGGPLPKAISDITSAIRWIKTNGHKYKLHQNKIVLWGNSQGGYLACLAACAGTYLEGFNTEMEFYNSDQMARAQSSEQHLQKLATEFGAGSASNATKVEAVVDLYGYFTMDSICANGKSYPIPSPILPMDFITPQTPPFFLMYGEKDPFIPSAQANQFASTLKKSIGNQFVEYLLLPSAEHGGGEFESPQFSRQIFVFLNSVLFN